MAQLIFKQKAKITISKIKIKNNFNLINKILFYNKPNNNNNFFKNNNNINSKLLNNK
jgi:hypothetical protein